MGRICFGVKILGNAPWAKFAGSSDERIQTWWLGKLFENPLFPKEFPLAVLYSDGSCFLAAPKTVVSQRSPGVFEPKKLKATHKDRDRILFFCDKYEIETVDKPKWWLL